MSSSPRITITFCIRCGWLLRSAWMAQELLTTFGADIGEVALRPGASGQFSIDVDDTVVWDRETDHGFPDISLLKQRVRDIVSPDRGLGHVDRKMQ